MPTLIKPQRITAALKAQVQIAEQQYQQRISEFYKMGDPTQRSELTADKRRPGYFLTSISGIRNIYERSAIKDSILFGKWEVYHGVWKVACELIKAWQAADIGGTFNAKKTEMLLAAHLSAHCMPDLMRVLPVAAVTRELCLLVERSITNGTRPYPYLHIELIKRKRGPISLSNMEQAGLQLAILEAGLGKCFMKP